MFVSLYNINYKDVKSAPTLLSPSVAMSVDCLHSLDGMNITQVMEQYILCNNCRECVILMLMATAPITI